VAEKKEDEVSQPTISDPDVHALEETLPTTVTTALPEEEKQQPEVGYSLQILKRVPLLKLDFHERRNSKKSFNFSLTIFFRAILNKS
jgi:hypothetical protein